MSGSGNIPPEPSVVEGSSGSSGWDEVSKEPFAGERNINDATGKVRTGSVFDLYPRQKGETNEEYGARIKWMREQTEEYQAAEAEREAKEGYQNSDFGKKEAERTAEFDRIAEKLDQAVAEGRMTKEHAEALKERELEKVIKTNDGYRQDYEDSKTVGTEEEQKAYQEWLKARAPETLSEDGGETPPPDGGETQPPDGGETPPPDGGETQPPEGGEDPNRPLVAINADFTRDRQDLARHYAKAELETENAKSNFFKQLWKGTLFKKYYEKKYEREILEGDRRIHVGDEQMDLDELINGRSGSAIKRFVLGVIDDPETSAFIHRDIGGRGQGEKLSEADQELTAAVRTEIERFASAEIPEGGSIEDLKLEFGNAIRRIQAERRDAGEDVNQKLINNYYEVALQARERVEHGIAIENVMEGFKVYNAEVRNNQRTEEHRDKIDSLINKLESGRLGQLLPAEVIAGVVGGAFALAQTGAQTAARATGLAGGFVVSGIFAGLKERNRVTEDRARMIRDAAVGLQYSGTSGESLEGMTRSERARAKYEARLGGTLYDLRPANELIEGINQAVESGDREAIIRAIAEARVRINFSDSEQKDLIAYSSADQMGNERTNLDIAVIDAERSLSEEDRAELGNMFNVVINRINESVDEKDADFRKVRTTQALKQAGKTMAIGALTFFASQEIIAAISPDKVGLLEKVGILKTQNNENASETLLAGLAGPRGTHTIEVANISGDRTEDIEALKDQGYTQVEVADGHTGIEPKVAEVPIRDSASAVNVEVDYLNNGTTVSDGLELRLYNDANGNFVAGMNGGTSTMNGEVFSFDRYASAGQIKGLMNIGGANVFIEPTINDAGQITFLVDANGNMTTTAGELVKAIGNNGEELFKTLSVVADVGENADGVTRVLSWATEVGNNTSDGTMMSVVNDIVEKAPVYNFVKNVTNEVFLGGVGIGVANRVSLGESRPGRAAEATPQPEGGETPPPEGGETQPPEGGETPPPEGGETQPPEGGETPPPEGGETQPPEGGETPPPEGGETLPPEVSEEVEREREERVRRVIDDSYGGVLGADGVDLITSRDELTADLASQFNDYWNNLNEAQKDAVRAIKQTVFDDPRWSSSNYGKAFREWFDNTVV